MSKLYPSAQNLWGNVLAAVDIETTGLVSGFHEIIQVGIVLLDYNIEPIKDVRPFYIDIKPQYPARATPEATRVHKLDMNELVLRGVNADRAADMLQDWFESLDLPPHKRLVALSHNWVFEHKFLIEWLGESILSDIFHPHPRDSMLIALGMNDTAVYRGDPPPFISVGLNDLCRLFGIINENPHDALSDSLAAAKVYKRLLERDFVI